MLKENKNIKLSLTISKWIELQETVNAFYDEAKTSKKFDKGGIR